MKNNIIIFILIAGVSFAAYAGLSSGERFNRSIAWLNCAKACKDKLTSNCEANYPKSKYPNEKDRIQKIQDCLAQGMRHVGGDPEFGECMNACARAYHGAE